MERREEASLPRGRGRGRGRPRSNPPVPSNRGRGRGGRGHGQAFNEPSNIDLSVDVCMEDRSDTSDEGEEVDPSYEPNRDARSQSLGWARSCGRGRARRAQAQQNLNIPRDPSPSNEQAPVTQDVLMEDPSNQTEPTNPELSPYPPLNKKQKGHRSEGVINGDDPGTLTIRHHRFFLDWDDRYKKYLVRAGFYGVHQLGNICAEKFIISALVERWRPETHTFHFPVGEMTITLQDVAMLFGLPIDGRPLVDETNPNEYPNMIEDYLGVPVDNQTFCMGNNTMINMSWLSAHFNPKKDKEEARNKPGKASKKTDKEKDEKEEKKKEECAARAYILMLLGSVLFTDISGNSVPVAYLQFLKDLDKVGEYSWGTAVLACLYKELCRCSLWSTKQMGGPSLLLQLWSWERFLFGRPKARNGVQEPALGGAIENERPPCGIRWAKLHDWTGGNARSLQYYRDEIDLMREYQVMWTPYHDINDDLLPPVCKASSHLWSCKAPLINLWMVEPYNPQRVMRQFKKYQECPPSPAVTFHSFTCRKRSKGNAATWRRDVQYYVTRWNNRENFLILENRPYDESPRSYDAYVKWFYSQTRPYIQPPRAIGPPSVHPREQYYQQRMPNILVAGERIKKMASEALQKRLEAADEDMKAFALSMLLGLEDVLKILLLNIQNVETFSKLKDILRQENHLEEQEQEQEQEQEHEEPKEEEAIHDESDKAGPSSPKRARGG